MSGKERFKMEIEKVIGMQLDDSSDKLVMNENRMKSNNEKHIMKDTNTSQYVSKQYCHCNSFSIPEKLRRQYGIDGNHIKAIQPLQVCEKCNTYIWIFINKETEDKCSFYAAEAKKLVNIFKVIDNEREMIGKHPNFNSSANSIRYTK